MILFQLITWVRGGGVACQKTPTSDDIIFEHPLIHASQISQLWPLLSHSAGEVFFLPYVVQAKSVFGHLLFTEPELWVIFRYIALQVTRQDSLPQVKLDKTLNLCLFGVWF